MMLVRSFVRSFVRSLLIGIFFSHFDPAFTYFILVLIDNQYNSEINIQAQLLNPFLREGSPILVVHSSSLS